MKRFYLQTVRVTFAAILLSFPLAFVLPVEISFENAVLENIQVIVLIATTILNLLLCGKGMERDVKFFHVSIAGIALLLVMRELSWGRVFFPEGIEESGPVFVDMSDYPFKIPVFIFVTLYVIALATLIFKHFPLKKLLRSELPIAGLIILTLTGILQYTAEHKPGILRMNRLEGQIFEEFNELFFYSTLPGICIYLNKSLKRKT